jgi:SAM-dependent methyltransferase
MPPLLRRLADRAFELPFVYRTLQAPFHERKIAPCLRHLALTPATRVLDVGCGPGTNAAHFHGVQYTGIDINPEYIASARRRHPGRFVVGDVTDPSVLPNERFDVVLLNSLMHHLPDEASHHLMSRLGQRLNPSGRLHILDLILPPDASPARLLARLDRGRFARPLEAWRALFERSMAVEHFAPFPLGVPGVALWQMIYCVGRAA